MVVMDPDTEFNALSTLYQSVVADMKGSYPAWETVGQRAVKLAAALKTTVGALAAFSDSVQQVSDLASNLKGASRDVGACVTRICMRQRALEGRLKSLSDALGDELAVGVHARTAFWKGRTAEMDKAAGKHVKKVRSRKGRPDETAMTTQRALVKQLLAEQRAQFGFFLSQLQPVLTAEVALLDEASHIRPSIESLESTVKGVDGEQLVDSIMRDLTQGADSAWKSVLISSSGGAGGGASFSLCSSTTTTSSEGEADGGSSRMTSPSVMGAGDSYAPLPSGLDVDGTPQQQHGHGHGTMQYHQHHQPIQHIYASLPGNGGSGGGGSIYSTPSASSINGHHQSATASGSMVTSTPSLPRPGALPPTVPINGPMGMNTVQRATLGRRLSSTSVPLAVPPTPSSLSASPVENAAVSSFRGSASELRLPQRPHSFIGGGLNGAATAAGAGNYAATPLLTPATTVGGGVYGCSSSLYGGSSSSSSSASASHPSAAATSSLIAETVQAIEGLGSDLEQYCCTPRAAEGGAATMRRMGGGDYVSSEVYLRNNNNGGAVRVRPESTARPLPPSRRSSAITSATPSAPSVAEARMSISGMSGASSLRTSRQSLISDGGGEAPPTPHSGPAPYQLIDPTTPISSFRPPAAQYGYGRQY